MKWVIFTLFAIALASCATFSYFNYTFSPRAATVSNDSISISSTLTQKRFLFSVTNHLSIPIKVNWDDATLVMNATSMRVMHSGVRYIARDQPQPPTVVAPGTTYSDEVVPVDNVSYAPGPYGGWSDQGVLPWYTHGNAEYVNAVMKMKGSSVALYLPIQIGQEEHFYSLVWQIDSIHIIQGGLPK